MADQEQLIEVLKTQLKGDNWEIFEKMSPEQQTAYLDTNKQTLLNIKQQMDRGETPSPPAFEIETFTRLSKSRIWKLMSNYFDRMGPDSWSTYKVPYFITCNSYIGKCYANMFSSFLIDLNNKGQLDTNQKVYVVELGTGSGKFSFHFLQAVKNMLPENPLLKHLCYVMTDFTENNVNFWKGNPGLTKFVKSGMLEFSVFNNYVHDSITLSNGFVLKEGSLKNPLCIVANYMFDTMAVDLFRFQNGKIFEGSMSLRSKQNEVDIENPDIFNRMVNVYQYADTPIDFYLNLNDGSAEHDKSIIYDDILRWYKDYYLVKDSKAASHVLFPVTMLNCLDRLAKWSNYKMLLLSADKGTSDPNTFMSTGDPYIAVHGSISMMANYHAAGLWFSQHGGVHYHNPQHDGGIRISCFISTEDGTSKDSVINSDITKYNNQQKSEWSEFSSAFNEYVLEFGPTDFYTLHKLISNSIQISVPLESAANVLKEAYNGVSFEETSKKLVESAKQVDVDTIIALLKLSYHDTDTYFNFREIIAEKVATMHPLMKQDLFRSLIKLWDNYYPMNKDRDLPFELGRIFYKTKDYNKAIEFYQCSAKTNISSLDVIYFNIGVCYKDIGLKESAITYAEKSLEVNPNYERSKQLLTILKNESDVDSIINKIKLNDS